MKSSRSKSGVDRWARRRGTPTTASAGLLIKFFMLSLCASMNLPSVTVSSEAVPSLTSLEIEQHTPYIRVARYGELKVQGLTDLPIAVMALEVPGRAPLNAWSTLTDPVPGLELVSAYE